MAEASEKAIADELGAVIASLRAGARAARRSMAALPGPSYPTVDAFQQALGRQFPVSRGMCAHIARWTPEAAEAVAGLLEVAKDGYQAAMEEIECPNCGEAGGCRHPAEAEFCQGCEDPVPCRCITPALAVARALNGTST